MLPGVDINELSQVISQQPGGVENLAEMMADMDPDLLEVLGKNKLLGKIKSFFQINSQWKTYKQ